MDKKKLILVWSTLVGIIFLMLFIEIGEDDEYTIKGSNDEVIILGSESTPATFEEPLVALPLAVNTTEENEEEVIVLPELGRLAVPSVLINKKSSAKTAAAAETATIAHQAQKHNDLAYKIFQGHRFNAVLTHAIHSDLPGMVIAQVSQDIYGYQAAIPLLPTGTRLVGQYNNRLKVGDSRVFINWERAITPEGVDIELGSIGTDRLGQTGLTGIVDNHFFEIFGTSSLLSVMAVGSSNLSSEQGEMSNQYQQAVTESLLETSDDVLKPRLQRQPTIHIPQGTIVHVVVAKDLDFSTVLKQAQKISIF